MRIIINLCLLNTDLCAPISQQGSALRQKKYSYKCKAGKRAEPDVSRSNLPQPLLQLHRYWIILASKMLISFSLDSFVLLLLLLYVTCIGHLCSTKHCMDHFMSIMPFKNLNHSMKQIILCSIKFTHFSDEETVLREER